MANLGPVTLSLFLYRTGHSVTLLSSDKRVDAAEARRIAGGQAPQIGDRVVSLREGEMFRLGSQATVVAHDDAGTTFTLRFDDGVEVEGFEAPHVRRVRAGGPLKHPLHEHALTPGPQGTTYVCRVCGARDLQSAATHRFRCATGCDWDACGRCLVLVDAGHPLVLATAAADNALVFDPERCHEDIRVENMNRTAVSVSNSKCNVQCKGALDGKAYMLL